MPAQTNAKTDNELNYLCAQSTQQKTVRGSRDWRLPKKKRKRKRADASGDDIISFSINFVRRDSSQFNWNKATIERKTAINSLSSNNWRQRFFPRRRGPAACIYSIIICVRECFLALKKLCRIWNSLESVIAKKRLECNNNFIDFFRVFACRVLEAPLSMQISRRLLENRRFWRATECVGSRWRRYQPRECAKQKLKTFN